MQLVDITLGNITVCLHWAQLVRLLACVRGQGEDTDTQDLELALESLVVLALVSDDLRTREAVANALEHTR